MATSEEIDRDSIEDAEATFEELAQIELDFEDLDSKMIAYQHILSAPLYEKRAATIKKIRNFWPLAFEMAPPEIDSLIQPTDSEVFATSLTDFSVDRFEIPKGATIASTDLGEPRSVSFRFEFLENEWFEDRVLEKKFYWRRSHDGFVGLISDPVKVHWKSGKDLTQGLLDAAVALADAVKAKGTEEYTLSNLKESQALSKKVEKSTEGAQSFFSWFGYIGRFISDEEHKAATKAFATKRADALTGNAKVGMSEVTEQGEIIDNDVYPDGPELAAVLANELWQGALAYFTNAHDDDAFDDFEDDDEDMGEDDEDDEAAFDIRSLVKDAQRDAGPPAKKRKA